jgi:hypothetical protein
MSNRTQAVMLKRIKKDWYFGRLVELAAVVLLIGDRAIDKRRSVLIPYQRGDFSYS